MLTITTPAASTALLTIEELRAAVGAKDGSKDVALARVGARVDATIARTCMIAAVPPTPPTLREEVLSETLRNVYEDAIILSRRPVSSITSVVVDDVTLDADEYEVDPETGMLYRLSEDVRISWCATVATIVYTAGWAAVPDDLKRAAELLALDFFSATGRDPNLRRVVVEGVGSHDYWVSPTTDPLVSQEVLDLLSPYTQRSL